MYNRKNKAMAIVCKSHVASKATDDLKEPKRKYK